MSDLRNYDSLYGYSDPYPYDKDFSSFMCNKKHCDITVKAKTIKQTKVYPDGQPIDFVRTIEWPFVVFVFILATAKVLLKK